MLFHCDSGYTHGPRCYVIRTLPVLLESELNNKTEYFIVFPISFPFASVFKALIISRLQYFELNYFRYVDVLLTVHLSIFMFC